MRGYFIKKMHRFKNMRKLIYTLNVKIKTYNEEESQLESLIKEAAKSTKTYYEIILSIKV